MRETTLPFPILGLIGVTRGILGVGLGLLLTPYIPKHRRVAVGASLAVVGALSTIPLAISVFRHRRLRAA